MASSTFLNMRKKLEEIEKEVAKLRDQPAKSSDEKIQEQLNKRINEMNEVLAASVGESAEVKRESSERLTALERQMEGIVSALADLKVAKQSHQPPLTLSIPAQPIPTQKELSPGIRKKLAEFSFEAVGGQTVRCVLCGKQQAYHSKRVAEHVCKE